MPSSTSTITPTIAAANDVAPTNQPVALQTPTRLVPSVTPSPIPTVTLELATIEPTATITSDAIATPPGIQSSEKVLWLLETNNGCQLPCWWGITPGQTKWEVAKKFFIPFAQPIESTSSSDITTYSPLIYLPSSIFKALNTSPSYTVREGIIEGILTRVAIGDIPDGYLTQYTLPAFLTTYGQPTEVWIATYPAAFEENELPFAVVLFYPKQGIMALYDDNGIMENGLVTGCPQTNPVAILKLTRPNLNLTFEQARGLSSAFNEKYLRLEEVTDMDVSTFYQQFKDPNNTLCLETPASWWR
ncbi:MAG: hypothetical protein H6668_04320 [Ardenticatenaceae bacterium]|nr:hypothetical protein [Ardenticatenaceae bacterium]